MRVLLILLLMVFTSCVHKIRGRVVEDDTITYINYHIIDDWGLYQFGDTIWLDKETHRVSKLPIQGIKVVIIQ